MTGPLRPLSPAQSPVASIFQRAKQLALEAIASGSLQKHGEFAPDATTSRSLPAAVVPLPGVLEKGDVKLGTDNRVFVLAPPGFQGEPTKMWYLAGRL